MSGGVYGGNLVPLVERDDQNTWTDFKGCCLLLARPEEASNAQKSGRRPHNKVGERRQFDLERIVLFALQHGYFDADDDSMDEA